VAKDSWLFRDVQNVAYRTPTSLAMEHVTQRLLIIQPNASGMVATAVRTLARLTVLLDVKLRKAESWETTDHLDFTVSIHRKERTSCLRNVMSQKKKE
jgi:hypothetical protein